MTNTEVPEKYKERFDQLIALRRQMMTQIGKLEGSLQFDKNAGEELADIGTENFSRVTNINLLNTEEVELDQIDEAIEKMYKNKYGICEDCGKDIEKGRLDAKPFAKYCVKHKEIREMREMGYDVSGVM